MQRHFYRTLLIYGVIAVSGFYIYPTLGWMTLSDEERESRLARWTQQDLSSEKLGYWGGIVQSAKRWASFDRSRVINLGLDLQGGIQMVLGFSMTEEAEERGLSKGQIQDMILQRVRNRVNDFEAKEPIIQKLGDDQIQIQLPGEKDIQRAKNLIMKMAELKFHMVAGPDEMNRVFRAVDRHFENGFIPFLELPFSRGEPYQVKKENFERVSHMISQLEETEGVIPADMMFAFSPPPPRGVDRGYFIYLMDKKEAMTGEGLNRAVARPDNRSPGSWQILFGFGTEASRVFADVTEANIGRSMAIALDGNVVSAPTIQSRIFGSGEITGSFTAEEAKDLAIALNSGSMPVPVREDYTGVVGATLTLPGIAGLILTIGMAVDANVLIFERIREELRNGKSLVSAIEGGYARATVTILDANITTLIAAAVLTQFGTGPVQGFAVTLSIGVCASVFAALVITLLKTLFNLIFRSSNLNHFIFNSRIFCNLPRCFSICTANKSCVENDFIPLFK